MLSPVLDPVTEWLSSLSAVRMLERGINALPPYAILILVAVPVLLRQGIKFFAFFLMASGAPLAGGVIYFGSRIANILVIERIYDAGRDKLLTIGWLQETHDWLERRSERRLAAFRETGIYASLKTLVDRGE